MGAQVPAGSPGPFTWTPLRETAYPGSGASASFACSPYHCLPLFPANSALQVRILREMTAKGEVPLRPGAAEFLDDALAAGARVAVVAATASVPDDALVTSAMYNLGPNRCGFPWRFCGQGLCVLRVQLMWHFAGGVRWVVVCVRAAGAGRLPRFQRPNLDAPAACSPACLPSCIPCRAFQLRVINMGGGGAAGAAGEGADDASASGGGGGGGENAPPALSFEQQVAEAQGKAKSQAAQEFVRAYNLQKASGMGLGVDPKVSRQGGGL